MQDFGAVLFAPAQFARTENWLETLFSHKPDVLYSVFTKQFSDYSKYVADFWDAEAKEKWHREQYPKNCRKAYDIGQKMAEELKSEKAQ